MINIWILIIAIGLDYYYLDYWDLQNILPWNEAICKLFDTRVFYWPFLTLRLVSVDISARWSTYIFLLILCLASLFLFLSQLLCLFHPPTLSSLQQSFSRSGTRCLWYKNYNICCFFNAFVWWEYLFLNVFAIGRCLDSLYGEK